MTRRNFLLSISLLGVYWGLSCFTYFCGVGFAGKFSKRGPEAKVCLFELFSDLNSAKTLGKRYLHLYPHEAENVLQWWTHFQSAQHLDPNTFRKTLARQREQDFLNNRIVLVDGWLLARTEVQVCALTILL